MVSARCARIIGAIVASAACAGSPTSPPAASAPVPAGQIVNFSLPSDDGVLVTVPLPGARATVLDFFGPTCEPCKKKVPELQTKRAELAGKGVKLVLVAVLGDGESTADARKALVSWGVSASFLVDKDGTAKREAGVTALPSTIILDGNGAVKWSAPPTASADDVVGALR